VNGTRIIERYDWIPKKKNLHVNGGWCNSEREGLLTTNLRAFEASLRPDNVFRSDITQRLVVGEVDSSI
jgi:hypothetical protein